MIKTTLKQFTIIDFIITLILCAMSFVSGFAKQLIIIFLLSFYSRFILNYALSKK